MNGGAWENVMGILADPNGLPRSGEIATNNQHSGFTGMLGNGSIYTGLPFPEAKYYDLYTSETSTTACDGGVCFGTPYQRLPHGMMILIILYLRQCRGLFEVGIQIIMREQESLTLVIPVDMVFPEILFVLLLPLMHKKIRKWLHTFSFVKKIVKK